MGPVFSWFLCLLPPALPPIDFSDAQASLASSLGTVRFDLKGPAQALGEKPPGLAGPLQGLTRRQVTAGGELTVHWDLAWDSTGHLFARLRATNTGAKSLSLSEAVPLSFTRRGLWKGGIVLQFDPYMFGYNRRHGLEPLIEGETAGGVYAVATNKPCLVAGFLSTNKTFGRAYVTPQRDGLRFTSSQPAEGTLLNPGMTREFEWLMVSVRGNPTEELETLGRVMAVVNQPKKRFSPSATWCTWYSSMVFPRSLKGELERFVLSNLPEAAAFRPFGVDRVRVVEDAPFTGPLDYPLVSDALPNGYAGVVKEAAKRGLKVGVWFDNTRSNVTSDATKQHPEWFARRPDGGPDRRETAKGYPDHYILDATTEGGRGLYEALPRRFRTTGIDYAFGDFTWNGLLTPERSHDPTLTSVEALRLGMLAFRKGLGEDAYWLSQQLHAANWDLVDSMRVSVDSWGTQLSAYRNARGLNFLHHRMFLCDPDAWRPEFLSLPWAEAWLSWQVLGGHPITVGGDLRKFTPEQRSILRRALPTLPTKSVPLDLWERRTGFGSAQSFERGDTKWTTVQLSNFRNSPVRLSLHPSSPVLVRSFWKDSFLGSFGSRVTRDLAPASGETLLLYPSLRRPQVVGVGSHLEQGALSLKDSRWEPRSRTLSVEVKPFTPDEPVEVKVFLPRGWKLAGASPPGAMGREVQGGRLLTFSPQADTRYKASLRFDGPEVPEEPADPPKVTLEASALVPQVLHSVLGKEVLLRATPAGGFDIEPMRGALFAVERGDCYEFSKRFSSRTGPAVWHDEEELFFRIDPKACGRAKRIGLILADPDSENRRVDVRVGLGDGSRLTTILQGVKCLEGPEERTKEVWVDLPAGASRHGVRVAVTQKAGANAAVAEVLLAKGAKTEGQPRRSGRR